MNTATHETNGKTVTRPETSVRDVSVALIDPCATQPRRTYDPVKLQELAENIKDMGVLQDILLRPSPATKGRYEIVYGERRWRATTMAGITTIPAKVRNLTDVQVLEIQIVENAKREDIHPMEEAEAYHALHSKHGYSVEQIASKVGKATATVTQRMKLLGLGPEARKAFVTGKFPLAVALVVASVPTGPKQKDFVADLCRYEAEPTRTEALRLLEQKYRLRLATAPFDRASTSLVAGAPACGGCPKRTSAQADLFGTMKDDFCLDAACFAAKCDATVKKRIETKVENEIVMPEKQATKLLGHGQLAYDSNYVDLTEKCYANGVHGKSFGDLLGKKRGEVEIVLARDGHGKLHELVAKKEFAVAVPKAGIRLASSSSKSTSSSKSHAKSEQDWKKKERERRAKAEAEAKVRREQISAIAAAAAKTPPNDGFWRVVVRALVRMNGIYGASESLILETLGLKKAKGYSPKHETQVLAAATKLKADKARALIVTMLLDDHRDGKSAETHADFRELYGIKTEPTMPARDAKAIASATKKFVTKTKAAKAAKKKGARK